MKIFFRLIFLVIIIGALFAGRTMMKDIEDNPMISNEVKQGNVDNEPNTIYTRFVKELEKYSEAISFYNADENVIIEQYKKVIKDYPEYFWVNSGYSYQKSTLGNNSEIVFKPKAVFNISTVEVKKKEFDRVINSIVAEANSKEGIFEKVLFVHDYIVNNTVYDTETAKLIDGNMDTAVFNNSINAYGCLVDGSAVCSGYSAAFQTVMKELGIECGRVSGNRIGGESHEWNYVVLDGEYYYVDVTWDDPVSEDGTDNLSHEYFLITTEELEKTHEIGEEQVVPVCTGEKYNYHRYNGLYLEEYSFEETSAITKACINSGLQVSMRFSSNEQRDLAVQDLFENDKVFQLPGIRGIYRRLSYSLGNSGLTLNLILGN